MLAKIRQHFCYVQGQEDQAAYALEPFLGKDRVQRQPHKAALRSWGAGWRGGLGRPFQAGVSTFLAVRGGL